MTEFRPTAGLTPYLSVDGARKAIDFYVQAFGATERETMAAEGSDRLMHAQVDVNGTPLFLADFFPEYGQPPARPQAFNLHLHVEDAQMWWDRAIGAGCTVVTPLKLEFWGDIYGQVMDPFGVIWAMGQSVEPEGDA